ncbi:MAG: TolC family protein [bacterium]
MEQAISLALNHSWSAQAAQADSTRAYQEYQAARAGRFPTLSLEASAFRVDDVIEVQFPFQRIELGSIDNYQADLRLRLPLFTGGKLSSGIEMRRRGLQAATTELEGKRLETAYQTRRAYLSLLLTEHLAAAAQSSQRRIGLIAENVENLYGAGLADSFDLIEVAAAKQQAEEAVVSRDTERRNAAARLQQLIGTDFAIATAALDTLPQPDAGLASLSPTEHQINRPELTKVDDQIQGANAAVSLAKAQYSPDLAAFVGYSAGKPNRDMFEKSWNDYFAVGAALSWNLNLGNQVGNQRQAAEAQVNALQLSRRQLLEMLLLQATTAANNVKSALQTYESRATELRLATDKYRLALGRQQAGGLSVNRLLEIETELATAEQLWRAALVGYFLNLTDYDYALGNESIYGGIQ